MIHPRQGHNKTTVLFLWLRKLNMQQLVQQQQQYAIFKLKILCTQFLIVIQCTAPWAAQQPTSQQAMIISTIRVPRLCLYIRAHHLLEFIPARSWTSPKSNMYISHQPHSCSHIVTLEFIDHCLKTQWRSLLSRNNALPGLQAGDGIYGITFSILIAHLHALTPTIA